MVTVDLLHVLNALFIYQVKFEKKNTVLHKNPIMLQNLLMNFRSSNGRSRTYGMLKTKENFQLLALKRGRSRLRELVPYKRLQT